MDNPSWNDTLRASLASCLPCLARPAADSDDTENDERVPGPGEASYAIRRARADELEGLLADVDDGDAAADADAISLHSHLGPRGRRRAPPRTPRHIALWGFNLFGSGRGRGVQLPADGDGADDPLHRAATGTADPLQRSGSGRSAEDAQPLDDADIERRRARKEMRRLAKAVAQQDADAADFAAGAGGSPLTPSAHRGIPAPFLPGPAPLPPAPSADALARMQAQDDDDAADLDGGACARLAPRGPGGGTGGSRSSGRSSSSGSGAGYERGSSAPYSPLGPHAGADSPLAKPPRKSKRSKKSKSSATSSTLASPRQEAFGPFASAPGGFLRAICPQTARIPPTHASKHIVQRHGTSRSLCTVSLHATVWAGVPVSRSFSPLAFLQYVPPLAITRFALFVSVLGRGVSGDRHGDTSPQPRSPCLCATIGPNNTGLDVARYLYSRQPARPRFNTRSSRMIFLGVFASLYGGRSADTTFSIVREAPASPNVVADLTRHRAPGTLGQT
ncbi:hypothetical protein FB451DRAFT_1567823 [Mycena latifolia]|nr:hypothetical protein FB451DRAFT_1567823 [Mycena latifolia]